MILTALLVAIVFGSFLSLVMLWFEDIHIPWHKVKTVKSYKALSPVTEKDFTKRFVALKSIENMLCRRDMDYLLRSETEITRKARRYFLHYVNQASGVNFSNNQKAASWIETLDDEGYKLLKAVRVLLGADIEIYKMDVSSRLDSIIEMDETQQAKVGTS